MGKGGSPDKWEIHIGVPRAGALGPLLPSTQKAVAGGRGGLGIIRHLRAGGRATTTSSRITSRRSRRASSR